MGGKICRQCLPRHSPVLGAAAPKVAVVQGYPSSVSERTRLGARTCSLHLLRMEVSNMLRREEEKILRTLEGGMATPKQLAEKLGKGYTELKAQSIVLTLARKGLVDKTKAALILHGTPMVKFLNYKIGGGLKGGTPVNKVR